MLVAGSNVALTASSDMPGSRFRCRRSACACGVCAACRVCACCTHQIYDHPWYNKNLPPGVKEMNDHPQPLPVGLQSQEEIQKIVAVSEGGLTAAGRGITLATWQ